MMRNRQDLDSLFRLSMENGEREPLHAYSSNIRVEIDPVAMRAGAYLLQYLYRIPTDSWRPIRLSEPRSRRPYRDVPLPPRDGTDTSPKQRPGLSPYFLGGYRSRFPAIELASASVRFRKPSLRKLFFRWIIEAQQQLLSELRTFIRREAQNGLLQRFGFHDFLLMRLRVVGGDPVHTCTRLMIGSARIVADPLRDRCRGRRRSRRR